VLQCGRDRVEDDATPEVCSHQRQVCHVIHNLEIRRTRSLQPTTDQFRAVRTDDPDSAPQLDVDHHSVDEGRPPISSVATAFVACQN
jgi:hypothetical protein